VLASPDVHQAVQPTSNLQSMKLSFVCWRQRKLLVDTANWAMIRVSAAATANTKTLPVRASLALCCLFYRLV